MEEKPLKANKVSPTLEKVISEEQIIAIGKQKISWQKILLLLLASISIVIVVLIFFYILINGILIIPEYGFFRFIFGTSWNPAGDIYGILHGIIGTTMVVIIAMVISVPISISCAIFMSEIAPPKLRSILKPTVELLAGIPSIVYGFFGLFVFVPLVKFLFKLPTGETALSGGLILSIMVIPTIVSITDDALKAIPPNYREGSLALGATKWQTIIRIVLPAAFSGVFAATILAFGRAIGETMAVLMVAGGASQVPVPFFNMLVPIDPLTAIIARELGEAGEGTTQFHAIFGIAIVLFVITFIVNFIGDLFIRRFSKKIHGAKITQKKTGRKTTDEAKITVNKSKDVKISYLDKKDIKNLSTDTALNFNSLPKRRRLITPKTREKVVFSLLASSAGIIFLVLLALVLVVIINGVKGLSFNVLFMSPSQENEWSMRPAIIGTILLIGGALVIAFPLGLGAAIYLTEFTREGKIVSIINYGINNLAGIPSIVFGAFGYAFFTLALHMGKSMYAGWFTLACMLLPTIIRTSQEAIKNVPNEYREGSFALGATKWRTIRHIVLPAATPGIITGVILSLGRAAGETAAIMFVGGSIIPAFLGFGGRFAALPIQLYLMAISAPSSTRNIQWAIALVLLLVVFVFNIGAIIMRSKSEKQKGR